MNRKLITGIFALTILPALILAAGGQQGPAAGAKVIPELRISIDYDQTTNDMFKEHGVEGLRMKQLVFNGITELDQNFNVVPGLAERWQISSDGLQYTFWLRKGVKFHNGREMTADDVKWTIEAFLDPNTGYSYKGDYDMIKKVDVLDKYSFRLTIDKPNAAFLAGIASGIKPVLAKESYKKGEGGLLELDKVIGTGPYKFIEWVQEDHMTLEAFDDYWAGAPNVKKITFKIVPDASVRLSALQAGDLDIIRTPPFNDLIAYLDKPEKGDWALAIAEGTQNLVYYLCLNNTAGPLKDKRVRQAMMYAVDREAYVKLITKGVAHLAHGCWPKGNLWASDVLPPAQDLNKAKKLLADAGYPNGVDLNVITAPAADIDKIAEIAQAQMAKVGIRLKLDIVEIGRFYDRESKMDWDIKNGGHSISIDPILLWNLVLRQNSPAWWWMGNYGSDEIDKLLDQGEVTTDVKKRKEIYNKVYQMIQDDAAVIWLHNLPITYGYRSNLVGIGFNTRGDLIYNNNQGIPWITRK
jgi:ABC-type transport system substrate-binding protein